MLNHQDPDHVRYRDQPDLHGSSSWIRDYGTSSRYKESSESGYLSQQKSQDLGYSSRYDNSPDAGYSSRYQKPLDSSYSSHLASQDSGYSSRYQKSPDLSYSSRYQKSPNSPYSSRHGLSWPSSASVSSSSFSITPIKSSSDSQPPYIYSHSAPPSHSSSVQIIPPDPDDTDPRFIFRYPSPSINGSLPTPRRHFAQTPRYQFPTKLDPSEIFPDSRLTYSEVSKHYKHDDETLAGRKIFKNPRNVPSEQCPRDEEAAKRMGRTCLRKCSSDSDGCLSRRKKCLCDGICGMSCIKPGEGVA
ncbi:hypothetical protein FHG87_004188 [Trinorchestia longiramus]|nr:hypothetical protein FHG87_004188 [Trinorchestia longiramus]